jgi:hypothetical protein
MLSSRDLQISRNYASVDGKSAFNRIEFRLGLESHDFVGSGLFEIRGELMDILKGRGRSWLVPAERGMFSTVLCATTDSVMMIHTGSVVGTESASIIQDLSRSE